MYVQLKFFMYPNSKNSIFSIKLFNVDYNNFEPRVGMSKEHKLSATVRYELTIPRLDLRVRGHDRLISVKNYSYQG